MKVNSSRIFLLSAGVGLGIGAYLLVQKLIERRRPKNIHLTSCDLNYSDLTPEQLASSDLTDLNTAESAELVELGLDRPSADRLIENRPYRNKLELLSRMVLGAEVYALIKDQVGVAGAREDYKIGTTA